MTTKQNENQDQFAAANQITSAQVVEHAKLLAELTRIRGEMLRMFPELRDQLHACARSLGFAAEIMRKSRPEAAALTKSLVPCYEHFANEATKLIEAEQAAMRG